MPKFPKASALELAVSYRYDTAVMAPGGTRILTAEYHFDTCIKRPRYSTGWYRYFQNVSYTDSNTAVAHPGREHTSLLGYGHIKTRVDISEKEKTNRQYTLHLRYITRFIPFSILKKKEVQFPSRIHDSHFI